MKRIGIFLIVTVLILMTGCNGCDGSSGPTIQYDLTVSSTAGGSVTDPGEGVYSYDEGAVVDLEAIPDSGYHFVSWTGDVGTVTDVNDATTTITMEDDYSITANFEANEVPPTQHDLTISSTDGGSVTDPSEGINTYDEGTVVNLAAVPDSGYHFVSWTGDVGTVADVNDATTTITMSGDYSITANFAEDAPPNQYDLTVSSGAGGSVTDPGEGNFGPYNEGAEVDLVAEAEESYCFDQWTGDVSTVADVNDATTTITMSGNYSIVANFVLFSGGSGTAEDPYQIGDWYNLDNVRNYLNGYYFVLINDLDSGSAGYPELADSGANGGAGWQPIGSLSSAALNGTFDGQGYTINDMSIYRINVSGIGLFGYVDGTIENVGVVDGSVTGKNDVGLLAGMNRGTINNSYSTGSVTGDGNDVGGLVGENSYGTVTNSYSTGSVTDSNNVGGLVGRNTYSTVNNSYSTGDVTGDNNVGGLVGKNDYGTVSNSYSTGSVTGSNGVGGLVGTNSGTVSNSFWDKDTSGVAGPNPGRGTGKTTAEMQDFDTFDGAGWDIVAVADSGTRNTDYIWNIVDDDTYPFLSWQS